MSTERKILGYSVPALERTQVLVKWATAQKIYGVCDGVREHWDGLLDITARSLKTMGKFSDGGPYGIAWWAHDALDWRTTAFGGLPSLAREEMCAFSDEFLDVVHHAWQVKDHGNREVPDIEPPYINWHRLALWIKALFLRIHGATLEEEEE